MILYINLIHALAHALVTMFFNMPGITGEVAKPSQKQQVVSVSATYQQHNRQNDYVFVAKNGQIILSNGTGEANLEWRIPYEPKTSSVFL